MSSQRANAIRDISGSTAQAISAAQVVVSLSAVVKELVENSIDAKSKQITIQLLDHPTPLNDSSNSSTLSSSTSAFSIVVMDDGTGIDFRNSDTVENFVRHRSSSKRQHLVKAAAPPSSSPSSPLLSSASTSNFDAFLSQQNLNNKSSSSGSQDSATADTIATSLGFRGEALHSIAQIAHLSVTSKVKDTHDSQQQQRHHPLKVKFFIGGTNDENGNNGNTPIPDPIAFPDSRSSGTKVTVENLFHSLPVRRSEFQRSKKKHISETIQALRLLALSRPEIRFHCSYQQQDQHQSGKFQTQLATSGSGDLQRALVDCYSARVCQSLKKFSTTSEDFTIDGYLSKIGSGRSSTDMQFFFLDGRPVKMQQIQRLINDCYNGAHASRTAVYPIAVLHLRSKPIEIEVEDDNNILIDGDVAVKVKKEVEDSSSSSEVGSVINSSNSTNNNVPKYDINLNPKKDKVLLGNEASLLNAIRVALTEWLKSGLNESSSLMANAASGLTLGTVKGSDGNNSSQQQKDNSTNNQISFSSGYNNNSSNTMMMMNNDGASSSQKTKSSAMNFDLILSQQTHQSSQKSTSDSSQKSFAAKEEREDDEQRVPEKELKADEQVDLESSSSSSSRSSSSSSETESDDDDNEAADNAGDVKQKQHHDIENSAKPEKKISTTLQLLLEDAEIQQKEREEQMASLSPTLQSGSSPFSPPSTTGLSNNNNNTKTLFVDDDDDEALATDSAPRSSSASQKNLTNSSSSSSGTIMNYSNNDNASSSSSITTTVDSHSSPELRRSQAKKLQLSSTSKFFNSSLSKRLNNSEFGTFRHASEDDDKKNGKKRNKSSGNKSSGKRRERDDPDGDKGTDETAAATAALAATTSWSKNGFEAAERDLNTLLSKEMFKDLRVIGQFNSGFILAISPSSGNIFIFDQHASDEKSNYEKNLKNMTSGEGNKCQPLLRPEIVYLGDDSVTAALEHSDKLSKLGFRVAAVEDEPGSLKVTSIPVLHHGTMSPSEIGEVVDQLKDYGAIVKFPEKFWYSAATAACRHSIMIGKTLDHQTMKRVIEKLETLDHPWNCPHGRPTVRHVAKLDPLTVVNDDDEKQTENTNDDVSAGSSSCSPFARFPFLGEGNRLEKLSKEVFAEELKVRNAEEDESEMLLMSSSSTMKKSAAKEQNVFAQFAHKS